jgi:uncharacterized protein (TIGR00369 family)
MSQTDAPDTQPPLALSPADWQARAERLDLWLGSLPFVQFLGVKWQADSGILHLTLPFVDKLIGNPMLPALHGGASGAFLEVAASAQVFLSAGLSQPAKPIDLTIDYLRTGRPRDLFAQAQVTKMGRRIANVRAEAWQDNREQLVAVLHGHFILPTDEED